MKRVRFTLLFSLTTIAIFAQADASDPAYRMEQVRSNPAMRWGEAASASKDEAREKAKEDFLTKLNTTVVATMHEENDNFSESLTAITVATVNNLKEIVYQVDGKWCCMVYISEGSLRQAEDDRKESILEMISIGIRQEGQVNIAEALKYYTWALRMLNLYNDKVNVDVDGISYNAKSWLSTHIPAVLSNISLSINPEKIVENPGEYEKYSVIVDATYDGRPVSVLDISYFNGESAVGPVHCKNGEGVIQFHDLSMFSNINLKVIYDYVNEGRNYSPELAAAYGKGFKKMPFNKQAAFRLPLRYNGAAATPNPQYESYNFVEPDEGSEVIILTCNLSEAEQKTVATPIFTKPRNTIARPTEDLEKYIMSIENVEKAIRAANYESVRELFTPEGFRIFELMMGSGKVSVCSKTPTYTVEHTGNFIVGKSIPVAVKTKRHISKENIVFRFEGESGKIKSVAYALTKRAEDDIFREAQWSYDSRYALLQFMEDYQTAYSLKRLDYIESIFSDDAIVIVGNVVGKKSKRMYEAKDMKNFSMPTNVNYTTYTKDGYIQHLKEDFASKDFIQLVFDDTYISKVGGTEAYIDNEVLWIELKQNYYSSNYSDKGYLALQINMKPTGSMINVRTWTPYFVPMAQLKKSFPIGIQKN